LMSTGCKSSHNGFLDVSRSNGGLSVSGWNQTEQQLSYRKQIARQLRKRYVEGINLVTA